MRNPNTTGIPLIDSEYLVKVLQFTAPEIVQLSIQHGLPFPIDEDENHNPLWDDDSVEIWRDNFYATLLKDPFPDCPSP